MIFFRLLPYILIAVFSLIVEYSRVRMLNDGSSYEQNPFTFLTSFFERRNRRISALNKAVNYVKPYEKIFGNLVLSNKYCTFAINSDRKTITCMSSVYNSFGKKMMLVAKDFSPMDVDEYFDMICEVFSYNTKYEDIYNSLTSVATIKDSVYSTKQVDTNIKNNEDVKKSSDCEVISINENIPSVDNDVVSLDLVDVNHSSEAELTALPGISIVMAKKIIAFRDQQRPFKSVDDFLAVMKIKPHFAKRLKPMLSANKINMRRVKKARTERIIDL